MGEVFAIPYARLEPWPSALQDVRDAGLTLPAMTPAQDAVPIQTLTAAQRDRSALLLGAAARRCCSALLLGAEGPGLSAKALDASDVRVVIPMRNGVDSLNVAAAAVAFWELCR